ncbi:ferritin-like domain-containing protein [Mucilaginibacter sp.]|uniref:ferritin-like domain-containing protein n=1 Tax=Mucilaginibacter sp. TaxID=1882438 RepID=UPI002845DB0F|nr:ferritin-like domain-containing protein [Mucilaginibacter sp.]MDR3694424.1 ferritin-like domain-containing protein [Mucilaginibacter sp.]
MLQSKFFSTDSEVTPANLGEAIQQAIEIEIATIPVYLYTYYSINRVPDQDTISGSLVQELVKSGKSLKEANKIALDLSAEIMVYANKAGALIMSVAIEEMLHMALSSNLKQALAGLPELIGKSPSVWPACLPGHEPEFPINRARLSLDQLVTFLKIESPDPLPDKKLLAAPIPYKTIGLFYKMIMDCIETNDLPYNTHSPQLLPGNAYYAQNNIDTVYYDKEHNPHFTNAADSGDLLYVKDRESAIHAIHCIVEQGEGFPGAQGFDKDGCVDCGKMIPPDYDDFDKEELSHFEKFAQIYCHYKSLNERFNKLGIGKIEISDYFVMNVPENPSTADYPAHIRPVSDFLNGVYTYLFVMVENCYKKSGNTQYELFMFGIHKSMIFILNSVCGDIMKLKYKSHKDGKEYFAAPTFEDYPFGLISSPKSQLIDLYTAAVAVYPAISYLGQRVQDLPDVGL